MSERSPDEAMRGSLRELLYFLGQDADREGLQETPARALEAMKFFTSGYQTDPAAILKTFEDGADRVDEMVVQLGVPFWSTCVVGSTFVETPRGRIPIQYLKDGDWIYTIDPSDYAVHLAQCRRPRMTRKNAKLVRVYADNDSVLCTPDHRFLTFNRGWVEARELRPGDRIVSIYRTRHNDGYVSLLGRRWNRRTAAGGQEVIRFADKTRMPEHQFVWQELNTNLPAWTPVHHRDERSWNNDPGNLDAMAIAEHNRTHRKLRLHNTRGTPEYERREAAAIESTKRQEVRARRAASVQEHWRQLKQNTLAYNQRRQQMRDGIAASRNHIILGVEKVPWREDVWCMEVPDTRCFFANGMGVHNCEHHLLPFWGVAHVGYIPQNRIVGLSKISRLVDVFARRLTVQEHLTVNIADALLNGLDARGVGVVLQARHSCMESRGVQKAGTITVTSVMRGVFRELPETRAEFLALVNQAVVGRVL